MQCGRLVSALNDEAGPGTTYPADNARDGPDISRSWDRSRKLPIDEHASPLDGGLSGVRRILHGRADHDIAVADVAVQQVRSVRRCSMC